MAFIAREKYKESLLSTRGMVYCWERCKAHLENGNIDMAKKEIKRIETSIGMRSVYTMGKVCKNSKCYKKIEVKVKSWKRKKL